MIGALSRGTRREHRRAWSLWRCRPVAVGLIAALAALPAAAAEYPLAPGQQVVGDIGQYVTRQGDVFPDIARRFDVGYTALVQANPGVDPWVPGVGRRITIPSLYILPDGPHQGIVINLAQWRLFYFPPDGGRVVTYPLGLGVIGASTPLGVSRIVRKEPNPTWYPPPSIRAERPDLPAMVPPGPDNPLGAYAMHLGWKNYLIHGTNKPDGVGRNVSHGCIRLYPEDIERLFGAVAVGTPVRVVNQPAATAWVGVGLYVEVYPSKGQTEAIDVERPFRPDPAAGVRELVRAAAGQYAAAIDWDAVDRAAQERTGMPVRVASASTYDRGVEQSDSGPRPAQEPTTDVYVPAEAQPYDGYAARPYAPASDRTDDPTATEQPNYYRELQLPYDGARRR